MSSHGRKLPIDKSSAHCVCLVRVNHYDEHHITFANISLYLYPGHRTLVDFVRVIDGGDDMEAVIVDAFKRYCVSNPLHPDAFPTVRKMEAEVVAMCLRMYNNPDGAGTTTSGGTESIIMSVKTHRDWARAVKGITEPEMLASTLGRLSLIHADCMNTYH